MQTGWLDGKHVVFGSVTKGMDVVKKIESFGSQSGKTSKPIVITDCGCDCLNSLCSCGIAFIQLRTALLVSALGVSGIQKMLLVTGSNLLHIVGWLAACLPACLSAWLSRSLCPMFTVQSLLGMQAAGVSPDTRGPGHLWSQIMSMLWRGCCPLGSPSYSILHSCAFSFPACA